VFDKTLVERLGTDEILPNLQGLADFVSLFGLALHSEPA
jgi:hypothetical protein